MVLIFGQNSFFQFVFFLFDLLISAICIGPVKSSAARPFTELIGPHQARQVSGNTIKGTFAFLFLFCFEGIPILEKLLRASDRNRTINMGMTVDEFPGHIRNDVLHRKGPHFFCQTGMEDHLKKDIPQLFPDAFYIAIIDGFKELIDFFHKFPAHTLMILGLIPRTASRAAQRPYDIHKRCQVHDTLFFFLIHGVSFSF